MSESKSKFNLYMTVAWVLIGVLFTVMFSGLAARDAADAPRAYVRVIDARGVESHYHANRTHAGRHSVTLYNVTDSEGAHYAEIVVFGGTMWVGVER